MLTHFLVVGYIRESTDQRSHLLSDDIHSQLSFLCYQYIHGESHPALKKASTVPQYKYQSVRKTEQSQLHKLPLKSAATEPGFKKIRVHCTKGDDTQQFSYFVGQQVNDLYDKLLINAKSTFSGVNTNNLKIFANNNNNNNNQTNSRRSYVEDVGDLVDKLDDSGDANKYLHLFVEDSTDSSSNPPHFISQSHSEEDCVSSQGAQIKKQAPLTPSTPDTRKHYVLSVQEEAQKPRSSAHFRTISDSSIREDSDSDSDSSSDDDSSSDSDAILYLDNDASDEVVLRQYGYEIMDKINDTFDGCIYEAEVLETEDKTPSSDISHVAIKKVTKDRFDPNNETITKEAAILTYLTIQNRAPRDNLCRFVELIETNATFYLVEEYGSSMTLGALVEKAHEYIKEGRLEKKEWRVFIKYFFWKCIVNMYWMNYDMNCCHLGLNMDNILVKNVEFVQKIDSVDTLRIDCKRISIKICDFSEAEVFSFDLEPNKFKCVKSGMSSNCQYKAPELFNGEMFNPIKADAFSMGAILHTMFTGNPPYHYPDESDEGFMALKYNKLSGHLHQNGFQSYISKQALRVMKALLNINPNKRWDTKNLLGFEWFSNYHKKQKSGINKKSKTQQLRHIQQQDLMKEFPFYQVR